MIKLESAHIEEFRGIRKLDIDFAQSTFAISGPNGSGKSGVIDAIEFGLTGQIGRLTGRGTKGLSVAEHGPHVDKTKFPDAAFVELKVFIPALKKSATITRKVSAPKKPKITPNDPAIKAALEEIADHPEITLSRREILRFILVEPTKRSEEILLKLEDIGQTRAALNTAHNRLQTFQKNAEGQVRASRDALQRHLQLAVFKAQDVLEAVNTRRKTLGLGERLNPECARELLSTFDIGPTRTMQQDVEFGVIQIVDIALKAISPAVNDPSTAITCIDQLGRILVRFVSRKPPVTLLCDPPHVVRVIVPWIDIEGLLDTAFEQIRHYSTSDIAVSLRLLRALDDVASTCHDPRIIELLVARGRRVVAGCAERLSPDHIEKLKQRLGALEARMDPFRTANSVEASL